jgi:hypothetical protein
MSSVRLESAGVRSRPGSGGYGDHTGEHRFECGLVGADEGVGGGCHGERVEEDVEHGAGGGWEVAAAHHGRFDRA